MTHMSSIKKAPKSNEPYCVRQQRISFRTFVSSLSQKHDFSPIYLVESMKNPKEDRHKMVLKPLAENFSMMCSVSLKKSHWKLNKWGTKEVEVLKTLKQSIPDEQ